MDDLVFTNCKTKKLNKSMDEDSGTKRKAKNLTKSMGEGGVTR